MPIGCGQAFCASQQQSLDYSFRCYLFWKLIFLVSSGLIASQLPLEVAHCIPLSPQSVSSHLIPCRVVSSQRFHLISSHVFSPFLSSSQLITPVLMSSYVIRAFLISSQLIWTLLFSVLLSFSILRSSSQLSSSQLFSCQVVSTHPISSHLISALRIPCQLISCLLISSLLFSHLLSSPRISQLISALLTSSPLTLRSSQSLAQNLLQNRVALGAKVTKTYDLEGLKKRKCCKRT